MEKEIRYKNAMCSDPEKIHVFLLKARTAHIGLFDGEFPYVVPMAYVWYNHKIYFHGSNAGRKNEILKRNTKSSITISEDYGFIIAQNPANASVSYTSVMMEGNTVVVDDLEESTTVLQLMLEKYLPAYYNVSIKPAFVDKHRSSLNARTETFVFEPESIRAKEIPGTIQDLFFGGRTLKNDNKTKEEAQKLAERFPMIKA